MYSNDKNTNTNKWYKEIYKKYKHKKINSRHIRRKIIYYTQIQNINKSTKKYKYIKINSKYIRRKKYYTRTKKYKEIYRKHRHIKINS